MGKSNLLYALRILFDKTISEHDLELTESDYNAYSGTDTIEITAYLCEVTEDCLLSTFGSAVKDGKVVIRYTNQKNGTSKGLEFNIVFHMDMYKWIIPNEYGDESSVQQDLNLHYVGLTRAKDACYIMNGTARFRSKKNDYIFAEPSSFLSKPGLAERRKDVRWEM